MESPSETRIVKAAVRSFLEVGYDRTTFDRIAKTARASKTTVYANFADKESLFDAACRAVLAPVVGSQPSFAADPRPAEDVLYDISCWIYSNFLQPDNLGLYRVNIEAAKHLPDLAGEMHRYRHDRGGAAASQYLQKLIDAGTLPVADGREAARLFGVVSVGGLYHLMGGPALGVEGRAAQARATANLFLHGAEAVDTEVAFALSAAVPEPAGGPQMRLSPERHDLLLETAADEFAAGGYANGSVDRIARITGIGLMTINRHHRNKAGLFRSAMLHRAVRLAPRVTFDPGASVSAALQAAGEAIMEQTYDPAMVRFQRSIIVDAPRDPLAAAMVHQCLFEPVLKALTGFLTERLELLQPATVARQFLILASNGNLALIDDRQPDGQKRHRHIMDVLAVLFPDARESIALCDR